MTWQVAGTDKIDLPPQIRGEEKILLFKGLAFYIFYNFYVHIQYLAASCLIL